jgi:hypothetical protein
MIDPAQATAKPLIDRHRSKSTLAFYEAAPHGELGKGGTLG